MGWETALWAIDRMMTSSNAPTNERQRLLQIENEIARLTAELEKIDAALARLHPFDRAA